MTEHKLTISALYRPGWHAFPHSQQLPLLQLAGLWLRDAGFYPGARVRVDVVEEGRLVVTRVEVGDRLGDEGSRCLLPPRRGVAAIGSAAGVGRRGEGPF